jgi:hypothetical protein
MVLSSYPFFFNWHFGVAINFIGSQVSILLYAQLAWEAAVSYSHRSICLVSVTVWFNGAIIVMSNWGGCVGGWLLIWTVENVSIPTTIGVSWSFVFFYELWNLPSSKPWATGPTFHLHLSTYTTITHFPDRFLKYVFLLTPWFSKERLYVAVLGSKFSCISLYQCARHDSAISPLRYSTPVVIVEEWSMGARIFRKCRSDPQILMA